MPQPAPAPAPSDFFGDGGALVGLAVAGLSLDDAMLFGDVAGGSPFLLQASALSPGEGGGFGFGGSASMVGQTAHPYSQAIIFAVPEVQPPGGLPDARGMFDPIDPRPPQPGQTRVLQVRGVAVTGGGLRVRFNQPIDLGRLMHEAGPGGAQRSPQIVLLRADRPVPGRIVPDPDGAGLIFVPDAGELPPGEYRIVLRSHQDGFVDRLGRLLDGDYDGAPGADYIGRFVIGERPALQARQLDAPPADAAAHSTGLALQPDHAAPADGSDDALQALLGGVGGASMLMASLGPWGLARASRPRGTRRRKAQRTPAAEPVVRLDGRASGRRQPLARAPGWVGGWLDAGEPAEGNHWQIRL